MIRAALLFILLATACDRNSGISGAIIDVADGSTTSAIESDEPPVSPNLTMAQEFMELVNEHRVRIGIGPLAHVPSLAKLAIEHSENMAKKLVPFGHSGFTSRCSDARKVVGGGNLCAENVTMGQIDAQSVFKAWMNSPDHRAHIEQDRHTHTGLGYSKNTSGKYYWTQIFIEKT